MEPAILHLQRELEYLDLLLHREVLRLRARYQMSLDEFRGLYVSDAHVDELLRHYSQPFDATEWTRRAEVTHTHNVALLTGGSEWGRIATEFGLSPIDQQLLVLALAPGIDPKYETLYQYLNNDVTRRYPTLALALRVFSESGEGRVREALAPGGTLFRTGLLRPAEPVGSFTATDSLSRHILAPYSQPAPPLALHRMSALETAALETAHRRSAPLLRAGTAIILEGGYGSGRAQIARAIASASGLDLVALDARNVRLERDTVDAFALDLALEARLGQAAIFIGHGDAWCGGDLPAAEAQRLLRGIESVPLCFACLPRSRWRDLLDGRRALDFRLAPPAYEKRLQLWEASLGAGAEAEKLARQFVLTQGQIESAVCATGDRLTVDGREGSAPFFEAARAQCGQSLARLAVKSSGSYEWADLVLPASTMAQVREIAAALGNRRTVYEQWRMAPRSGAFGLNVLFSGSSGTGKTMTAGVIAAEAGLDLYRIDLSGLVSKYIGETEKNLDRLFAAARDSNAIVLFDEADALFGKRSDVRDAHDRYANIEVAYLLQKLEEHDGVVILATNLPGNIDDAFARRIQFQVDFPLPGESHREQIWRRMFPEQAPLAADIDFGFLARQFALTGGQIRSISVDAAFLAAQNGRWITMRLLVKAVARQMLKSGRIPSANEFLQYFGALSGEG